MKINIPELGGRLRRARIATGLTQKAVAHQIGVSWMTIHRWELSQRPIPDTLLERVSGIYDIPLRWFLTLEYGDVNDECGQSGQAPAIADRAYPVAADRILRKMGDLPAEQRPMIQKAVEDLIDDLRRVG